MIFQLSATSKFFQILLQGKFTLEIRDNQERKLNLSLKNFLGQTILTQNFVPGKNTTFNITNQPKEFTLQRSPVAGRKSVRKLFCNKLFN